MGRLRSAFRRGPGGRDGTREASGGQLVTPSERPSQSPARSDRPPPASHGSPDLFFIQLRTYPCGYFHSVSSKIL